MWLPALTFIAAFNSAAYPELTVTVRTFRDCMHREQTELGLFPLIEEEGLVDPGRLTK